MKKMLIILSLVLLSILMFSCVASKPLVINPKYDRVDNINPSQFSDIKVQ